MVVRVVGPGYPLAMTNILLKMAIEIVSFPMKNGVAFHTLLVYEEVKHH